MIYVIGIVKIKAGKGAQTLLIEKISTNIYSNTVCIPILTTCVKGKAINLCHVGLTL